MTLAAENVVTYQTTTVSYGVPNIIRRLDIGLSAMPSSLLPDLTATSVADQWESTAETKFLIPHTCRLSICNYKDEYSYKMLWYTSEHGTP